LQHTKTGLRTTLDTHVFTFPPQHIIQNRLTSVTSKFDVNLTALVNNWDGKLCACTAQDPNICYRAAVGACDLVFDGELGLALINALI
jgi:hypothetical protein